MKRMICIIFTLLLSICTLSIARGSDCKDLIKAAKSGDHERLKMLLDENCDVDLKDMFRATALINTAAEGFVNCIEDNGFNKNIKEMSKYHLISYEIAPQHFVKAISEGSNVIDSINIKIEFEQAFEKEITDLRIKGERLGRIEAALEAGHFKVITTLIENGADINAQDINNETALMKASRIGDAMTVKVLIKNGADVNLKSSDGWSALEFALDAKHRVTASILFGSGVDPGMTLSSGDKLIKYAISNNYTDIVRTIIFKRIDLDIPLDKRGNTPLISFIMKNDRKMAELLLKKGADINAADNGGNSPLMFAIRRNNISIIKLLLSNGANVNHQNNDVESALIWAVKRGFKDSASILLGAGANVGDTDKDNKTVLEIAEERHDNKLYKILKDAGAK